MAARESGLWVQHGPALLALAAQHTRPNGTINWAGVARGIPGTTPTACRLKHAALLEAGTRPVVVESPAVLPPLPEPTLSVPPFAVPLPAVATVTSAPGLVAFHYTDSHMGMQDDRALAVVLAIAREAQPDVLIHGGDLLDAYFLSRFDHNPDHPATIQDEIDLARTHLHQMAQAAPQARRVLLEGNHEQRLSRAIWGMPGTASEIGKLTAFREAVTWPSLLGLGQIGWEWVPTERQTRTEILPGLVTKHGSVVRKWSGTTGQGEWLRYGRSGISGHVHRLGVFYHRDHNGAHVWVEGGCTCSLEQEYVQDPDWQQGCTVITWDEDGERFNVEPVYIQDGVAVWRGRRFRA